MKSIFLLGFICLFGELFGLSSKKLSTSWSGFKSTHRKKYSNQLEESLRFQIYKSNAEFIEKHNLRADRGEVSFRLKMNKFGDLTPNEFIKIVNGFDTGFASQQSKNFKIYTRKSLKEPSTVDWRSKVTPVKNQGRCGACWAFSTTGSIEAHHAIKTGRLISLSEQNLMDCSSSFGNNGCNGGFMNNAFNYIIKNGAINSANLYPYESQTKACRFRSEDPNKISIKGFMKIRPGDEKDLANAIAFKGPVSVPVDASQQTFMFYSTGVYFDPNCKNGFTNLNHAVLAVGYGVQNGNKYFLLKNSWGKSWGEQGYMMIAKDRGNHCGITTEASFPIL